MAVSALAAPRDWTAADEQHEALPRPVMSTHDLMEFFNEPVYHDLKEILGAQSVNKDHWGNVRRSANQLAEVANLIAIRPEAREFDGWEQQTAELQKSAIALAHAARQQDEAAARRAWMDAIRHCNACHQSTKPDHAPQLEAFEEGN